jgi:hypothetical protein
MRQQCVLGYRIVSAVKRWRAYFRCPALLSKPVIVALMEPRGPSGSRILVPIAAVSRLLFEKDLEEFDW